MGEMTMIKETPKINTNYDYIHFVKIGDKPKTEVWSCRARDESEIGRVLWYGKWHQYGYYPANFMIYSAGCLRDVADFIRQLMSVRRYELLTAE